MLTKHNNVHENILEIIGGNIFFLFMRQFMFCKIDNYTKCE